MRWILIIVVLILAAIAAIFAYVRLAPTDIAAVHAAGTPRDPGDYPADAGFTAVRALTTPPEGILMASERVALQTPRTRLLAGSVEEGILTFETRSRVMGFPDYTSFSIIGAGEAPGANPAPLLMIEARSRFGKYDMGVNKARVEDWLSQLGPLVAAP